MKLEDYFKLTPTKKIVLDESAPAFLKDFIREVHDGSLPNDEVYRDCYLAAIAVDEGEDGNALPDLCTNELLSWVCNGPYVHINYVDDVLRALQTTSLLDAIGYAQFTRRNELAGQLRDLMEELRNESA